MHATAPHLRPRMQVYSPNISNTIQLLPTPHIRFFSPNLASVPATPGHRVSPALTGGFVRPTIAPPMAALTPELPLHQPRAPRFVPAPPAPSHSPAITIAPRFPSLSCPALPSQPVNQNTSCLPTPSFNNLPLGNQLQTPKEYIVNPTKLFNVRDGVVPYQEIDGCCYFDPSYLSDKPPPGLQYGYPQRGKRRKAMRLSSRFPTQAGKFHHHANFYVRSCAEATVGQRGENSTE